MEDGAKFVRIRDRIINLTRIVDAQYARHDDTPEMSEHDRLMLRFAGEVECVAYHGEEARAIWHVLWQQARDVSYMGGRPLPER